MNGIILSVKFLLIIILGIFNGEQIDNEIGEKLEFKKVVSVIIGVFVGGVLFLIVIVLIILIFKKGLSR